jgi:hypothetical protein
MSTYEPKQFLRGTLGIHHRQATITQVLDYGRYFGGVLRTRLRPSNSGAWSCGRIVLHCARHEALSTNLTDSATTR